MNNWEKEFDKKFRYRFNLCDKNDGVEVNGNWNFIKEFISTLIDEDKSIKLEEILVAYKIGRITLDEASYIIKNIII